MSAFELDRSQWRSFLELLGKDIRKVRLRSFFPKGHPLKERDRGKKSNANGDWIKHCQEEGRGVYLVINDGEDTDSSITGCRAFFYEHDDISKDKQLWIWKELGLPENPDFNGAEQEGIGYAQVTISKGKRNSTAVAFLKPAQKRSNLQVATGALANHVILNDKQATGLVYEIQGVQHTAYASREVIVSCGAYGSPHLLELSGIGDPQIIKSAGITPLHSLPGVGKNLHDHQIFRMRWRLKGNLNTYNERVHGLRALYEGARYIFSRTGVLTNPTNPVNAFFKTRPEIATPDVQLQFFPGTYVSIRDRTLDKEPGVTLGPTLLRPEARGSVHATSSNPKESPSILTNVLGTPEDERSAVTAMRFSRKLMETEAIKPFFDYEMTPGSDVKTDDEFLAYAKEIGASNWHPASSCRMGADSDPMAVVDLTCKVRGIGGLRVVDASVMPTVISGNTNAPTIMIAEKISAAILAGT